MSGSFRLPKDFDSHLKIDNAAERFDEGLVVGEKLANAGVPLLPNPDHAAIFTDPPHLVAGPLKELGYVLGWDARCYPSPVDGEDYINVSAALSDQAPARAKGWFDYVAVVHPVDDVAREKMLSHGYGNPWIHHVTFGIAPPERGTADDLEYAAQLIEFMKNVRTQAKDAVGEQPGTLIAAIPEEVRTDARFEERIAGCVGDLDPTEYQIESMEGGGCLLQFFVLAGGRIEVALRVGTSQTFNPKSVHKISKDEISTDQS
jgi:hypothetical protein